jgi:DNA invertase Pin-like site-specific DNA recombinase
LARNTRDAIEISEKLTKCGADLASLHDSIDTTNASGGCFFKIMAALAEFERESPWSDTTDAMRRHQDQRTAACRRDYHSAFKSIQRIPEDDPEKGEQELLQRIIQMYKDGLGIQPICREMTRLGIKFRVAGTGIR